MSEGLERCAPEWQARVGSVGEADPVGKVPTRYRLTDAANPCYVSRQLVVPTVRVQEEAGGWIVRL